MKLILIFTALLQASLSYGYSSTLNTGEVVGTGKYRILGDLQYLGDPRGFNVTAGLDTGITESSDIRVVGGIGSVSFHTGLFYKWVPFPDVGDQPAIGVIGGGTWARYNSEDYPGLRVSPLVSKKFDTDYGFITPYVALPFGVISGPKKNIFPLQLEVGGEWTPVDMEPWKFFVELGLSLNEASSYGCVAVSYEFSDD